MATELVAANPLVAVNLALVGVLLLVLLVLALRELDGGA